LGYYDLASIAILLGINVDNISMLQGIEAGKVSNVPRWLTMLIVRPMEVLSVFLP